MSAAPDKLTAFFASLDRVLAVLARPDFQIAELNQRIAHNDRCKAYLSRHPSQNYNAFDLTAIDCGLAARLKDAEARLRADPAPDADAALTKANVERGQRLLTITETPNRKAA